MPKGLITDILNGVHNEEIVNFMDAGLFMMPQLCTCLISDKTLQDKHCLFVLWATLKFKVPASLSNAEDTMFIRLTEFFDCASSKDKNYTIFPHILSHY